MVDVGRTLWHYCHTLRHDGMDYGEYLDQLTYLLFLKMADERGVALPQGAGWDKLTHCDAEVLLETYQEILTKLKCGRGLVGDIYASARSGFSRPSSLGQILSLLDQIEWSALPSDVQADAFEYLLEQAAAEGKKGAGQYFTPRLLVESIVECVKPGALPSDRLVSDPAAGTGGFLVAAHAWALNELGSPSAVEKRGMSFQGTELVSRARRLGLMNLMLHGVTEPVLSLSDAIYDDPPLSNYDVVLTNPPFGSKGSNPPVRSDFWAVTSSKQLNFVQHVVAILKEGGRAALVLPDNCFFGDQASLLWPGLVERCNVHTVLRLPRGTFSPYTSGTRTNVLFLEKGRPTETTWVYDARTGLPAIGRGNPLSRDTLKEFRTCFGPDPRAQSARNVLHSPGRRWNAFQIQELSRRQYQLDQLPWQAPVEMLQTHESPILVLESILRDVDAVAEDVRALLKELGN
ncbi:N-6 DNA methylase [Micromonospora echinaurantiaca]|uniref:class I SAM-dependent DNA methyltransferase n=1 Tax=Micromonospora echinaurantiaca TaxID=47857 RepID=UPI003711AC3F